MRRIPRWCRAAPRHPRDFISPTASEAMKGTPSSLSLSLSPASLSNRVHGQQLCMSHSFSSDLVERLFRQSRNLLGAASAHAIYMRPVFPYLFLFLFFPARIDAQLISNVCVEYAKLYECVSFEKMLVQHQTSLCTTYTRPWRAPYVYNTLDSRLNPLPPLPYIRVTCTLTDTRGSSYRRFYEHLSFYLLRVS